MENRARAGLHGVFTCVTVAIWSGGAWGGVPACDPGPAGWLGLGGGTDSTVRAVEVFDDGGGAGFGVYAAGDFGSPGSFIARWNGGGWSALPTGPDATVRALAGYVDPDDGDRLLFVGGDMQLLPGHTFEQACVVWNGASWLGVSHPLLGTVHALEVVDLGDGPRVMAGGDFVFTLPISGMPEYQHLAVYGGLFGDAWNPYFLADGDGGLDDPTPPTPIYAIESWDAGTGPALFVGGAFTAVGTLPTWGVAGWDPVSETWFDLSLGVLNDTGDPEGTARALEVFDDGSGEALYVGGAFDGAFGVASHGVIRWDGAQWSSVGGGVPAAYRPAEVRALEAFDDGSGEALYVGGMFRTDEPLGFGSPGILRWDGTAWAEVEMGVAGSVLGMATDRYSGADALYAGGGFSMAGGVAHNNVAAYGHAYAPGSVHYVPDADGEWSDSLNWSSHPSVPGEMDLGEDVCLGVSPGITVRTGDFDTTINSICSTGHLWVDATHQSWEFLVEGDSEIETLRVTGGTFEAHAEVVTNRVLWSGGWLADPTFDNEQIEGTIRIQDELDIFGAADKTLRTNLVVENAALWSSTGNVRVGNSNLWSSITIAPTGSFLIQTDADMVYAQGATAHMPFTNEGVLTKVAGLGDGVTQLRVDFINDGDVFVNSGALELFGYGTYRGAIHVAPGAELRFAGAQLPEHVLETGSLLDAQGDVTIEGDAAEVIVQPGATFDVQGQLTVTGRAPALTINEDVVAPVLVYSPEQVITASRIDGTASLTVTQSMVWTGSYLEPEGGVTSLGSLEISGANGKRLSQALTNEGSASWLEGDMVVRHNMAQGTNGGIVNGAGATFEVLEDVTAAVPGGHDPAFENHGLLRKVAGSGDGVFHWEGHLNNCGVIEIVSGAIAVDGDSTTSVFTQLAGETRLLGGDLHVVNSSASDEPARIQGGVVSGDQSVIGGVDNTGGVIAPGVDAPGGLVIDGAYMQGAGGTLEIEIAETAARAFDNDTLHVTGGVSLDGVLDVRLLDGAAPAVGSSFTVLTSDGAMTGAFESVAGDGVWDVSYGSNSVAITLLEVPTCAGDIDGDGDTDIFDFAIFAPAFGTSVGEPEYVPEADLDESGTIDVFDFGIVAPDFGCVP